MRDSSIYKYSSITESGRRETCQTSWTPVDSRDSPYHPQRLMRAPRDRYENVTVRWVKSRRLALMLIGTYRGTMTERNESAGESTQDSSQSIPFSMYDQRREVRAHVLRKSHSAWRADKTRSARLAIRGVVSGHPPFLSKGERRDLRSYKMLPP